jgi:hypothetical protein
MQHDGVERAIAGTSHAPWMPEATVVGLLNAAVVGLTQPRTRVRQTAETVVSVRVVRVGSTTTLTRAGPLTPYVVQTLAEDVRGAEAGARLDATVDADSSELEVVWVRRQLGPIRRRGVSVTVARARRPGLR